MSARLALTGAEIHPESSKALGSNGQINLMRLYADIIESDVPTEVWVSGHGHHANSRMHTFLKLSPADAIELGSGLISVGQEALALRRDRNAS